MILPWSTYSRIEVTCVGGAVTTRCVVRRTSPAGFVDQVDDITSGTQAGQPATLADLNAKLAACVAWQNLAGADPASTSSRFELVCFFEAVTIVCVSQVNGQAVASNETEITGASDGPFPLADAQALLQAAHDWVVTAKSL